MKPALTFLGLVCVCSVALGGEERLPYAASDIVPPSTAYEQTVREGAPDRPSATAAKRRVLVFSLRTGYDHLVIPHVNRVVQVVGEKSGAYDADVTSALEPLLPANLAKYDVLVLNNNCSVGPRRDLFLDELETNPKYGGLSKDEKGVFADTLERSLLGFVANGRGLVVLHGGVVMQNSSTPFTSMVGAAFDYHPPNQEVILRSVDETHPLTRAFKDHNPFIHRDEPYVFKGPYVNLDFRPLLVMDTTKLKDASGRVDDDVRYVSWIRRHGEGRVFYCSPSHFPDTYLSPTMLRYLLDGIQYAAGDLKCEDSPIGRE
ncbi:MAG: ThuA domain-containing protein [Limisphaerales bacterium]|jgi:type 1 glutamine amidotransferase